MNKPKVVHHNKETHDVYIGRPSVWGNPFSHKTGTLAKYKTKNRKEAIEKFREYLLNSPELMSRLHELKGKTLGCWCKPAACHGDVLLELANKEPEIETK